jgi:nicotinic acid mononucleotide adenylyltransferase
VEDSEAHRAGPSYTVDTLEELNRRHPGNEWFLLLGSDSLVDLPGWYNPAGIVQRASLLVMNRPGAPGNPQGSLWTFPGGRTALPGNRSPLDRPGQPGFAGPGCGRT